MVYNHYFVFFFQYMIRDRLSSCDIVDLEQVISKGLEIAFLKELQMSVVNISNDIKNVFLQKLR